ncbi:SprT-like family domain-containing protein [Trichoderma gracile]
MANYQLSSSYCDSDDDEELPALDVLLARLPGRTTQLQPSRSRTILDSRSRETTVVNLEEDEGYCDGSGKGSAIKKPDPSLRLSRTAREESITSLATEGIQKRWWPSSRKLRDDVDEKEESAPRSYRRTIHGQESRPRPRTIETNKSSTSSTKEPQASTIRPRPSLKRADEASASPSSTSSDTSVKLRESQLLIIEISDSSDQEEPATQRPRSVPSKGSRTTKHSQRSQSPGLKNGKDVIRPFSRLSIDQHTLLEDDNLQVDDPTPSCPILSPKRKTQTKPALPKVKDHIADILRQLDSDDDWDGPPIIPETKPFRLTASKTTSAKKQTKKSFEAKKTQLATDFLRQLDTRITHGKIGELTESTGGVKIVWSNTLKTTAGRANWKRETVVSKQTSDSGAAGEKQYRHHSSIELSEKVIDDEQRLLNVIAHEFCHLANFMVSGITDNPHGKEFKAWAAKCSQSFASQGIKVTTKHNYEIDFKYVWACTACGCEYKRHSKSIDPKRHRCGACKAALEQTKPPPRQTPAAGQLSGYQLFVKEQMKVVKSENPTIPQKEIMGIIAEKWAKAKN